MTNGTLRRFGCIVRQPHMFAIWWPTFILPSPCVRLPLPHQRSTETFAPPGVLNQVPVQPSHHMATCPAGTSYPSISSTSQVPHSGNVLLIQLSRVISEIL